MAKKKDKSKSSGEQGKRSANKQQEPSRWGKGDYPFILTDLVFRFLNKGLWPATCCFCAYCLYLAAFELAGKRTDANIITRLVFDWGLNNIVAYAAGATGVGYGLYERKARIKGLKEERDRNERYEGLADPHRTSSGLVDGGLVPED